MTDRGPEQSLWYETAVKQLLPRLRLPDIFEEDGSMSSPIDTFKAAWSVILWVKPPEKSSHTNRMKYHQVEQLVKLLGYAQTGVAIARVEPGVIVGRMLQRPGPECRIYGWNVGDDEEFFDDPSIDEYRLMFAIMVQCGQYLNGMFLLDKESALVVLRRSDLKDDVLDSIWKLVDNRKQGFLTRNGIVRMLRLLNCAWRKEHLHPRLSENRQQVSQKSGCLLSPIPRPLISAPSSTAEPSPPNQSLSPAQQPSRPASPSPMSQAPVPAPTPPVLASSSPPPSVPALSPAPQSTGLLPPSSPQRSSSPVQQPPALPPRPPSSSVVQSDSGVQGVANPSTLTPASPSMQEATLPTEPAEVQTLTEDNGPRSTIPERVNLQDEIVPIPSPALQVPQQHQTTSGENSKDANHSATPTVYDLRSLMNQLSQLISERRPAGPGQNDVRLPPEVPPCLRAETSRSGEDAGARIETPGNSVASLLIPISIPAATLSPSPAAPAPLLMSSENLSPGSSNFVERNPPSERPPQYHNPQNFLNRPVSPAPSQRSSTSNEVIQTHPQRSVINNDGTTCPRPLDRNTEALPPPYRGPSLPPTPLQPGPSRNPSRYHSGANDQYSQIPISQGSPEQNRVLQRFGPRPRPPPRYQRLLPSPPRGQVDPRSANPRPASLEAPEPSNPLQTRHWVEQLHARSLSGGDGHRVDPEYIPARRQSQYGAAICPLPSGVRGRQSVTVAAQPEHGGSSYTELSYLPQTPAEMQAPPPPYELLPKGDA